MEERYELVALTKGQQDWLIGLLERLSSDSRGYENLVEDAISMIKGKPPGDPT